MNYRKMEILMTMDSCQKCNDSRYLWDSEAKVHKPCQCLVKFRYREHLGILADELSLTSSPLKEELKIKRNVVLQGDSRLVKAHLRYFLIGKGTNFSFLLADATRMIEIYVGADPDYPTKRAAIDPDLIVIFLGSDKLNSQFGAVMNYFVEARRMEKKQTWFSWDPQQTTMAVLQRLYGEIVPKITDPTKYFQYRITKEQTIPLVKTAQKGQS